MKQFLIALTLLVTPSLSHAFEYFDGCYVEFFDPGVCAPSGGFFNCTGSMFSDSFHFGFAVAGLCGAFIDSIDETILAEDQVLVCSAAVAVRDIAIANRDAAIAAKNNEVLKLKKKIKKLKTQCG